MYGFTTTGDKGPQIGDFWPSGACSGLGLTWAKSGPLGLGWLASVAGPLWLGNLGGAGVASAAGHRLGWVSAGAGSAGIPCGGLVRLLGVRAALGLGLLGLVSLC